MKRERTEEPQTCYQIILNRYETFSNSQKRVADYIITNFHDVLYFPMAKLVDSIGVSYAAIVRFAQHLGFQGFNELRDGLFAYYRDFMAPDGRMRHSIEELESEPLSYGNITRRDIAYLQQSIASIDEQMFQGAVRALCVATRIYVFGVGPDERLACHLHFRLRRLKLDTQRISDSGRNLFEHLLLLRTTDVAVLYTFAKPSVDFKRLLRLCGERAVPVVLITDLQTPPLVRQEKYLLQAARGSPGTFPSPLVPMAVTNALLLGVADRLGEWALDALRELGELRHRYYHQDS